MTEDSKVDAREMKVESMIAYRDRDIDGDIWSERVFVFKTPDDARSFFTPDNPHLINIYTEEDDRILNDFKIYDNNSITDITCVSFTTNYAGEVNLYKMNMGFFVK